MYIFISVSLSIYIYIYLIVATNSIIILFAVRPKSDQFTPRPAAPPPAAAHCDS